MAKKYSSKDLFDGSLFGKQLEEAKAFLRTMRALIKLYQSHGESAKKEVIKVNELSAEGIEQINKANEELLSLKKALDKAQKSEAKATDKLIKLQEKENKVKKTQADLTDEEIKEKIKLQKLNRERKKQLEAELILENKQIKSRAELREQIKALRIEADKLDFGSEELKEANAEIDKLVDQLTDASDKFVQNKINIGNYKEATQDLTNSFDDQNKRLKILTDTYKDAVAQGKKNTKEAKELKKELEEQKDAIDDVTDATKKQEKANKTLGNVIKAGGIGLLVGLLAKLGDAFGSSRQATLDSAKAMNRFTEVAKVLFASLVSAFQGVKIIFAALSQSFNNSLDSINKFVIEAKQSFLELKGVFTDVSEETKELEKSLADVEKRQKEAEKNNITFAEGWDKITDSFSGYSDTVKKSINFQDKYLELQLATEISIQKQERALGGLAEKRQLLQDISDDDTLGFETRALAVKKAQEVAEDFAEKEIKLAKTKEKLTIQAVKGELLRSKTVTDSQLQEIKTGEQLSEFLSDKSIALKVSNDTEQAFTDAFTERLDKESEALSFRRDQEEKNRKTERDSFEQRADIIEEFGELQFAKNKEILESDKATYEERNNAIIKNRKLEKDLFNQSVDLIIEQGKKSIDLNNKLTDSEKKIAKAKLDKDVITKLANETDEQEIFNTIRKLDLGEIEEKRLKEAVKRKQEQNTDLISQQESLNESNRNALEIQKDIDLQKIALEETTNEKLETLEKERAKDEKENLKERIAELKEGSIERLELERELNNILLDEKQEAIDKDKELDEKAAEERKELQKSTIEYLRNASDQYYQNEFKKIDELINASKTREQELITAAQNGVQLTEESINFERQKQAELEAEKKKLEEQQARRELFLVGLNQLAVNDGNLGKTFSDLFKMKEFAKVFPLFYDGTEDTGEGGNIDNKGGFHAILHPHERVLTAEQNARIGDISNEQLTSIAEMNNVGFRGTSLVGLNYTTQFEELKNEIKELPNRMPEYNLQWLPIEKALKETIKRGGSTTNRIHRTRL